MIKTKIAFDFDGVIADTTKKKQEWLKKQNIELINVDKTSFYQDLKKTMNKEKIDELYKKMGEYIFTQETLMETEAIEGAIGIIKKIANKYDIYIITARTQQLILHVKKWLKKNDVEQNIKKIISSSVEEKQDICYKENIKFLCDDDIRHLEKEKIENRILFCSNKIRKYSKIQEVRSWREIEEILTKNKTINKNIYY